MITTKEKLPKKRTMKLYAFKNADTRGLETTTSAHTDPTTTCTTILTTTGFMIN